MPKALDIRFEGRIDHSIYEIHHREEYEKACQALNLKLRKMEGFQDFSLADLIKANAGEVTDLACSIANHDLYFSAITGKGIAFPHDISGVLIDRSFGTFARFKVCIIFH